MCQIHTAVSAVVRSWWLDGAATDRLMQQAADEISYHQHRNAQARESHTRTNAVKTLTMAVLMDLGEKSAPGVTAAPRKQTLPTKLDDGQRSQNCIAAMLRMKMADHNDGSGRLYATACRTVEHDLSDADAVKAIREYAGHKPFPREWTDEEILQRVRDAEKVCQRGCAFHPERDGDGFIRLGTRDSISGRLVLSPRKTLPTAEAYVREFHTHREGRTIHNHAGMLLVWRHNRFVAIENEAIKKRLHAWLHEARRYVHNRQTGEMKLVDFESNPTTVKAAIETLRSHVHLPVTVTPPSWLVDDSYNPPANELLPCLSMLLNLPTMKRLEPTPTFFTTNALDFDHDPQEPPPMAWLRFLHELFDDDIESQDLLQEWCGYCLTGNTSLQKMLLLVGPRRSGKGTIGRVLRRLIGEGNVCGPTTSSLAGLFGLQSLLGKTLAIVSDARFSSENVSTVVERLLCISGEDALTVDRKFLGSVTMKLPTRFMFLTNELPRLNDASGALAGRFVILRTTKSFFGKEDPKLTERLMAELPGILNWAIEGWQRLRERGRFVMPQSVEDAVREIEDLSSPVGAFVREECVVEAGHRIDVDDLYKAWERWCERDGRSRSTTKQRFGRDLISAVSGVKRRRGTGDVPFYEGLCLREGSR